MKLSKNPITIFLIFTTIVLFAGTTRAEINLPSVIGDHMVLQRDMPVPIWGWSAPGQSVTIQFEAQKVTGQADDTGKWMVHLDPLAAGGPHEMSIQAGDDQRILTDILVGEVWLCTGQSNMDMRLEKVADAQAEIAAADHPNLRLFRVERAMSDEPQDHVKAKWAASTPHDAAKFSAAGYFLGRDLQKELNVPVGLLHCAYGGTPAEAWVSREALEAKPSLSSIVAKQFAKEKKHEQELVKYQQAVDQGHASAEEPASILDRHNPWVLYNAMLHPLIPYAVRGATWYQGESNVWHSHQYRPLLTTLIEDWRSRWGQPHMPFGIVQLPNYVNPPRVPRGDFSWAELRESQLQVSQDLPEVGLVVTIDIGDPTDIHPLNKQDVGKRLAAWALSSVYGRDIASSGPVFREASFEGNKVILSFDHVGSGLTARGDGPLKGFVIAGPDRKFRWANAEVVGDQIVVWEKKVAQPLAVRYAWDENPYWANLINADDLPATPFRTDDWPGITEHNPTDPWVR